MSDPIAELLIEKTSTNAAENQQRLADNTSYHRRIFLNRGKVGLYTNWIQYVTHSDYDEHGQWVAIPGEKAVFMNPQKTSKKNQRGQASLIQAWRHVA